MYRALALQVNATLCVSILFLVAGRSHVLTSNSHAFHACSGNAVRVYPFNYSGVLSCSSLHFPFTFPDPSSLQVELLISILALVKGELDIVRSSMIGSILSNTLLVLGMCFFGGGLRFHEQAYGTRAAQLNISLLGIAIPSFILPLAFRKPLPVSEYLQQDLRLTRSPRSPRPLCRCRDRREQLGRPSRRRAHAVAEHVKGNLLPPSHRLRLLLVLP